MSQCACKYSVIKHHYYFPTVNVYAMLHQCHFNYEYHDYLCYCCFNSYSTPFPADITANPIAICNLDADATAKNINFSD